MRWPDGLGAGACALVLIASCAKGTSGATYTTFAELEDRRIGVTTGSVQATQATKRFPNAKIMQYGSTTDMLTALRSHKIDAFAAGNMISLIMKNTEPRLVFLDEHLSDTADVAAIFPKTDEGRTLCDEYSDYIRKIKASGEYERILDVWLGADRAAQVPPDMGDLTPTRGTLRMAIDTSIVPFEYVKDGRLAGVDPAIAHGFAESRGYAIEPLIMDFGGIIAAITSGKADFMAGSVSHTSERAESVLFSEPTYRGYSADCVLGAPEGSKSITDQLVEGFEKTFVREGHWGLFVRGVATTLAITVSSCALGAALGFCLYLIWRGRGGDSGEILPRLCR